MEGLDELYRRVEICERLIPLLPGTSHFKSGSSHRGGLRCGGKVKYKQIIFPYQNEVLVRHNGVEYTLNYGHINEERGNFGTGCWINISKPEILFLDKTIIQANPNLREHLNYGRFKPELKQYFGHGQLSEIVNEVGQDTIKNDAYKGEPHIPTDIKIDLWNEMISQLIPANPDAVETITRETINEALFETRLKIHKIKNPPYVIGTENPSLTPRMNQLMYTNSPPVTPRPHMQLVPRGNQLLYFPTRRLSRNHAMRRTKHNKNRIWGPKNSVTL